ncbi:hypothetical protein J3R04_001688 [Spirilliplanes yamanashiensis]|nr:hypothetical protein [Spirilliplanes yamanashiensis]
MIEVRTAHAADENELTRRLTAWNVSLESMTYAHRSDYPV